jgi:hypothetical protein
MWPFRKKSDSGSPPSPPSPSSPSEWGPIDALFATYVLDVIGHLTPEKDRGVESMAPELQRALRTTASTWRGIVAEALHLSDTIDVAILDLWYRNSDIVRDRGDSLAPEVYARMFVEQYSKEGSQVDVWEGNALERAKERIALRRS